MRFRLLLLFFTLLALGMLLSWVTIPAASLSAQGVPNLVTNTPQPTLALPTASADQYALRAWQEPDLLNMLYDALNRLAANENGARNLVRLILYELSQRFPGAPHDPAERERLLAAMLDAPRGSVDMRPIVRPYVESVLNDAQPDFSERSAVSSGNFTVEILPARLNNDEFPDAVIHTVASGVLYEDYTLATIDAQGVYRLYASTPSLPAAPFEDMQSIALERIADVTNDDVEELVVLVNRQGNVNPIQMFIYSVRGQQAVSLTPAGQEIRFGRLLGFPDDIPRVSAADYRLESPEWGCISDQIVTWTWGGNAFQYAIANESAGYVQQNTLTCALFQTEPLFSIPTSEAINSIQNAIAQYSTGEPGTNRAGMVLAMLNYLAGSTELALQQAQRLLQIAPDDRWVAEQAQALIAAASDSENTPLDVCAAVQAASAYGACDVDQVLTRVFLEEPLSRDGSIVAQLEERGFTVLQTTDFTEAGRAPRTAVRLDIEGSSWLAFAPTTREFYTTEVLVVPPAGFEVIEPPPTQVAPPSQVYETLTVANDFAGALSLLDNAQRAGQGAPLTPEGLYLRALAYDLLFDRTNAQRAYFELWSAYPSTIWGQFAAAHLELR
jgi:hypothetical protein